MGTKECCQYLSIIECKRDKTDIRHCKNVLYEVNINKNLYDNETDGTWNRTVNG